MQRRVFLGLAGTAATSLAGCTRSGTGNPGTQAGTPTDTVTPTGNETTETDPSAGESYYLSVSFDSLQPGIVTPNSPDSIGVTRLSGQYLYVTVSVESGPPPGSEDLAFAFDGSQFEPLTFDRPWRGTPWRAHVGNPYFDGEEPTGEGWVLFELPETGDAGDARLSWPGGNWTPQESLVERLETPTPPFDVSVDAPERIDSGEQPSLTVTVENQGDVRGGFVGALNRVGPQIAYAPVERATLTVPAGEQRQWHWNGADVPTGSPESSPGNEIVLKFNWIAGDADRTVTIAAESTTSETPS